jgi:hypothetical protein
MALPYLTEEASVVVEQCLTDPKCNTKYPEIQIQAIFLSQKMNDANNGEVLISIYYALVQLLDGYEEHQKGKTDGVWHN